MNVWRSEVYERYRTCCFENGFHPENSANFALRELRRDWKLEKALDGETRFRAHKGVTAFLSDWISATDCGHVAH